MTQPRQAALDSARKTHEKLIGDLESFLRFPSISNDPNHAAHLGEAAQWLVNQLNDLGATQVAIHPTARHPIVYGELKAADANAPTILIYGHYDVQPPDPLRDWQSEPFEPTIKDDYLFARGVTDMKGQIMAGIGAVRSLKQSAVLPVNIKFLLEGEEEIGSPSLKKFLADQRELLTCDYVLNLDAGMIDVGVPTISYSLRGGAGVTLTIKGPSQDLHSGTFGGVVQNPIHVLCELIAGMHDDQGHVTLKGFYDKVRPISPAEHAESLALPMDEKFFLEATGVPQLWGEKEFLPVERTGARPTLEVLMIQGGAPKSAITSQASARISMRLVPDQNPQEAVEQMKNYLTAHMPPTVTWTLEGGGHPPVITERESAGVKALAQALESAWGKPPVFHRVGGSIPVVAQMQEILKIDSLLTGFALPTDNLHGPNERLHLPTWKLGIEALIHFFYNVKEFKA